MKQYVLSVKTTARVLVPAKLWKEVSDLFGFSPKQKSVMIFGEDLFATSTVWDIKNSCDYSKPLIHFIDDLRILS